MNNNEILEYEIPAVKLKQSGHLIGKLNLYEYQDNALEVIQNSGACIVEINAGTGMGKTAIATLATLKNTTRAALLVYPTNELVENQVHSIKKICSKAGIDEPEIVIVHATDLLRLMEEMNYESKALALKDALYPSVDGKAKFVLTNPDTLHLMIRLRYGGKRRYGQRAAEILNLLGTYNTLVIDEFHFYERRELASLYYDLSLARYVNLFDHILLMTATPHKGIQEYLDRIAHASNMSRPDPIICNSNVDGTIVVHNIKLEIRSQGRDEFNLIQIKDHLVSLRDELRDLREQNPGDEFIPACVILNSVIGARTLTEMLLEEFNQIEIKESHGLIPQQMRRDRANALVLVGTSAIEVGIDFDTSHLVFEAWDSASALQRLGRVGRHRSGKAILFAPTYVYNYFDKYVSAIKSRDELNNHIRNAYGEKDPGFWYISSSIARLETQLMIDELGKYLEATPAAGSFASVDSLRNYFEMIFSDNDAFSDIQEWSDIIKKTAHRFVTLRSSEPQALVIDYSAERKGLFPAYFSPISRILRRAAKYRVRGIDPKESLRPLYALKSKTQDERFAETIESLISEYRIHFAHGRKFCVMDVFEYMKNKYRSIKMNCAMKIPSAIKFKPIIGINEEDFIGATLGIIGHEKGIDEINKLFVDRFYAIVDQDTYGQLAWGLESYPIAESKNNARVFFDGSALVVIAKYLSLNKGVKNND